MKKVLLAGLLVVISGCTKVVTTETQTNFCTEEQSKALTDFVLNCAKNANPMSDEEPEDMLYACKNIAKEFICPLTDVKITCNTTSSNCSMYNAHKVEPIK